MSADNTQSMKILLVGSGGLVGQGVALACAGSGRVQHVTALVRREGASPAGFQEMVLPDFLQAAVEANHRRFIQKDDCGRALAGLHHLLGDLIAARLIRT